MVGRRGLLLPQTIMWFFGNVLVYLALFLLGAWIAIEYFGLDPNFAGDLIMAIQFGMVIATVYFGASVLILKRR